MGTFDNWTLVSDIDGTLLPHGMMSLSDESRSAIDHFQKEGGVFTFATGRYLGGALNVCRFLGVDAPFIYNNGASIYIPDSKDFVAVLTLGQDILPLLHDVKACFPSCGLAGYSKESMFVLQMNGPLERHFARQQIAPAKMESEENIQHCCKLLITVEAAEMSALKQIIAQKSYFHQFQFAQSSPEFYEITSLGATKGAQLPVLCDLLKRPFSKLITMGDNENDISSLKIAPFSFAVANATDEAKAAARFVTEKRGDTESAIAEVICIMENIIKKGESNGTI